MMKRPAMHSLHVPDGKEIKHTKMPDASVGLAGTASTAAKPVVDGAADRRGCPECAWCLCASLEGWSRGRFGRSRVGVLRVGVDVRQCARCVTCTAGTPSHEEGGGVAGTHTEDEDDEDEEEEEEGEDDEEEAKEAVAADGTQAAAGAKDAVATDRTQWMGLRNVDGLPIVCCFRSCCVEPPHVVNHVCGKLIHFGGQLQRR